MESNNILVIQSLGLHKRSVEYSMIYHSVLEATLKAYNPVTGRCFTEIQILARGRGTEDLECMRTCIQAFLQGKVELNYKFYWDYGCTLSRKIHHVDIQLQEPFRQMFYDLFDPTQWMIPKELSYEQDQ